MVSSQIINGKYELKEKLGSGGFGEVYKVWDSHRNQYFAMKIDSHTKGNVIQESITLKYLQGGEGIPKLYDCGKTTDYSFMVMQLLGDNLNSYIKKSSLNILDSVTIILIQALSRIEYVHSKGVIHRDIKPSQFLIGPHNLIYLVDYGISKRYIIDNYHITYQNNCSRTGSYCYASLNAHSGIRLSRRDDIESLIYSAIFLIKGILPWSQEKGTSENKKWNNAFLAKRTLNESNFRGFPKEIFLIFNYARNLKFDEKPDYLYLKTLVMNIRKDYQFSLSQLKLHREKEKSRTQITKKNTCDLKSIHKDVQIEDVVIQRKRVKKSFTTVSNNQLTKNNNSLNIPIFNQISNSTCIGTTILTKSFTNTEETQKNIYPGFANKKKIMESFLSYQRKISKK